MVEAAVLVRCFDGRRLMTIRTIIPAAGLLLAGCTSPPDTPPLWVTEHGRIYCYATIADPDCSKAPVPGADRRLIAVAPRLSFVPLDPAPPVSPSSAEGPVPLGPHDQQSETKGAT